MRQYEVRWAVLPDPIGRRPVLLLSRNAAFDYLSKVLVAEITTRVRTIPQEVRLGRSEGLRQESVANLDNLHVVDRSRIGILLGRLPAAREIEVKTALGSVLAWPELLAPGDQGR